MVSRSKLRQAVAAERGIDHRKVKEKKKYKAALKRKSDGNDVVVNSNYDGERDGHGPESDRADDTEEETESKYDKWGDEDEQTNIAAIDESDTSESSVDYESAESRERKVANHDGSTLNDEGYNSEEDIPVSDLEDLEEEDREDLVPHTRLTINNTAALLAAVKRISIPTNNTTSFASHQSAVSSLPTAESIPDISDDLQRELAFYSQSLEAVRQGRTKLRAEGVPFSRPKDYFAEMLKEDAHMEKIKAKLVEEASSKKAAAEARKLRDLKKFGKQVQVAKLQERQKAKRETLDKIKVLKRKRQEAGGDQGTKEADLFDVGVDNEIAKYSHRSGAGRGGDSGPNAKRQKKNEKYGFGGKKKHAKSGDALSSGDLSGFNAKRMKGGGAGRVSKPQRPGKGRRKAMGAR